MLTQLKCAMTTQCNSPAIFTPTLTTSSQPRRLLFTFHVFYIYCTFVLLNVGRAFFGMETFNHTRARGLLIATRHPTIVAVINQSRAHLALDCDDWQCLSCSVPHSTSLYPSCITFYSQHVWIFKLVYRRGGYCIQLVPEAERGPIHCWSSGSMSDQRYPLFCLLIAFSHAFTAALLINETPVLLADSKVPGKTLTLQYIALLFMQPQLHRGPYLSSNINILQ